MLRLPQSICSLNQGIRSISQKPFRLYLIHWAFYSLGLGLKAPNLLRPMKVVCTGPQIEKDGWIRKGSIHSLEYTIFKSWTLSYINMTLRVHNFALDRTTLTHHRCYTPPQFRLISKTKLTKTDVRDWICTSVTELILCAHI